MVKLQEKNGQNIVTLPIDAIRQLGWKKGDNLWISADPTGNYLILRKVDKK